VRAAGLRIPLVVTHRDDPRETIWFGSVERLARENGLDVATPDDPREVAGQLASIAPDFVFSFYYRHMLPATMLASARRGAYNVHGSLLPKYRGRVPVNWAILRGERETGATLHEMVQKPDAGRIVDRMAVPILPDDTAFDVFRKVTVAAEIVLHRSLPAIIAGTAALAPQDLASGSYFGGRKPEDGRIDWSQGAQRVHDLVRAVAPPYPGAFTEVEGTRVRILRTRIADFDTAGTANTIAVDGESRLVAHCDDGTAVQVLSWTDADVPQDAAAFARRFGAGAHRLGGAA
jgi:methionyl-tRNA formyltransferase